MQKTHLKKQNRASGVAFDKLRVKRFLVFY